MYYRSHDGLRLYARIDDGPGRSAPTVLCLHGLTRNSRDFEELAPHLQAHYRVLAPDFRGRGLSERDPEPQNYRPQIYLEDTLALLEAAGTASCAIIGTSLGGLVAMMLAAAHRSIVAGIVLNDIGPQIDPAGIERIKNYAGRMPPALSWDDAVRQTRSLYGRAWPDLDPDRWARIARRGFREDEAGIPQPDADPMIGETLRNSPAGAPDLWPLWAHLRDVPMLAIRGALSDVLNPATFARMRAEKPDLEQLTLPNRGHVPLLDEPESLRAIDGFLGELFA